MTRDADAREGDAGGRCAGARGAPTRKKNDAAGDAGAGGADRGQLVLLAAAVIVVALVPMLLAYLQLGYHGDVGAEVERPTPGEDATRLLDRSVYEVAAGIDGEFEWTNRSGATARVDAALDRRVRRIEAADAPDGTVVEVERNATAAERWAAANCPSGPMREFGPCEATDGVIVQRRAGEVTLLAVAFDVQVTSTRRDARLRRVVRVAG